MRSDRRWTLPNTITLLRLLLAPAFALAGSDVARGAVLALAAASEWLDGWLARRLGQISRLGELLDPIVDRVFVLAALLTFVGIGRLEILELALLLLRDGYTALAGALAVLFGWSIPLRARFPGKVVTTLQLGALLVLLLRPRWIEEYLPLVVLASAIAILDYTRAGLRSLRRAAPPEG